MVKALRATAALAALLALVLLIRTGHPDLGGEEASARWSPVGIHALGSGRGIAALALSAAAFALIVAAWRPGRRAYPATFFDENEKLRIREAIDAAEARTSGEIRVHLERRTPGDPLAVARAVFVALGMTKTAARNGVLIYISTEDRAFAIVGDDGIHRVVPEGFWDDVRARMAARFSEDRFAEGIVDAAGAVGEKLARYFPIEAGDKNELPNEISTGQGEFR